MEKLIPSAHGYVLSKRIPLGLGLFHTIPGLRPNVHTIHPKFYAILVIFNTI